jgi:hypothetical protein
VFVIDWTTTGCDDPTGTEPTSAVTVVLRGAKGTARGARENVEI